MIGTFEIHCNFCGSHYRAIPVADGTARLPPNDSMVCASTPCCPVCVDDPVRIKQVRERVIQRLRARPPIAG
jgi:hydrogenase maturation factor